MGWTLKFVKTKGYEWSSKKRKEKYQVNLFFTVITYFIGIGLGAYSFWALYNLQFLACFASLLAAVYFFLVFVVFGQSTDFLCTIDRLDKIEHKVDTLCKRKARGP